MTNLSQGLIQVYTGNSKGKTTAALGLAVRAVGHGFKVYIIQFMKGRTDYGELNSLKKLAPECRLEHFGRQGWVIKGQPAAEDIQEAERALTRAREVMLSGAWDIVILDEILNAIWFELVSEENVLTFLDLKPPQVELVLTGRNATDRIKEKADYVTEMVQLKHPYEQGIDARKGIEY
ncbi:cob(I)yrinic acid a,c-diamide adenosyltransferase [Paradesulfitobacterium ferrireducens]|uniref:cob(I)yrinic acid a,c-diamide adenosyltransferase n=1 Tax=Paradesulfitobacterium ferrireducens TaxID=2816476 RepID=UPI001A903600|nr:cob(I)yrinic acid a,c-diamide adenosyltransferase [Paradesulfitobacterium ferrireducens]